MVILHETEDRKALAKEVYDKLTAAEQGDLAWKAFLAAGREGLAGVKRVLKGIPFIRWERATEG